MVQVILHQVARNSAQCFLYGSHLRDDVGAIAVFFHHFLQAADLPFDTAEAVLIGSFEFGIDADGLASAGIASTIHRGGVPVPFSRVRSRRLSCHCRHNTPHPYIYPRPLLHVK